MRNTVLQALIAFFLVFAASYDAEAARSQRDSMLETAGECTRFFPSYEHIRGIPSNLLAAISVTETGRLHPQTGQRLPWPWTVHAEGKGYYYDTKREAVRAVTKLIKRGVQNIDVGCMQVNLKYHPKAFRSVSQAFDPRYNVGYASQFLTEKYAETGGWTKAVATYHSKTPSKGKRYSNKVMAAWKGQSGRGTMHGVQLTRTVSYTPSPKRIKVVQRKAQAPLMAYSVRSDTVSHDSSKPLTVASNEIVNGVRVVRLGSTVTD